MELDWSTFLLEVINFLILVWLLKRFLYQPVLRIVEQRRKKIEAELTEAAEKAQQANDLQQQYESRLADWQKEKDHALEALQQQLAQERNKQLQQLENELQQQQLKQQALHQQQQTELRQHAELEALQLAGAFASRLLKALSCPQLNHQLQQLFIDQLIALPESSIREVRESWKEESTPVEVSSATPLNDEAQQVIRQALEQKLGPSPIDFHFRHDERLIAGLKVAIGGWVLQANLQNELRFFSEAAANHE